MGINTIVVFLSAYAIQNDCCDMMIVSTYWKSRHGRIGSMAVNHNNSHLVFVELTRQIIMSIDTTKQNNPGW
jgi:hypothetical protein